MNISEALGGTGFAGIFRCKGFEENLPLLYQSDMRLYGIDMRGEGELLQEDYSFGKDLHRKLHSLLLYLYVFLTQVYQRLLLTT